MERKSMGIEWKGKAWEWKEKEKHGNRMERKSMGIEWKETIQCRVSHFSNCFPFVITMSCVIVGISTHI
jgi:hypothetical protein